MGDNYDPQFYFLTTKAKPVTVNGKPKTVNGKPVTVYGKPVTVNGKPKTVNGKPVTVNGKPVTVYGKPVTGYGKPVTVNGKRKTVNGKPVTVYGKPATVNGKPATVNGKPGSVNGKPVTVNGKPATVNGKPGSVNGKPVTVNGKPVTVNGKHSERLHVVDIEDEDLEPGTTDSDIHQPIGNSENVSTVMTFHDIVYTVQGSHKCCQKMSKKIIKGVSGVFEPGLNAIMGATGSGKTSLLDVMASRKDPSGLKGSILVNGQKQPDNFKHMSGYVVQDDIVFGTLTVRENLRFSANLRLPSHVTAAKKEERVTNIIHELGLPHVADSKVGTEFIRGISGGERKRTNIGMELIINPTVLFLDEPTTGLDASTAYAVMSLLHQLGVKGRTIIFSLHQPRYSIFNLFTNLVLLSRGHMVYHGPAQEALTYFSTIGYQCEVHNNPTDFFLDIINGDSTAVQQFSSTKGDESKRLGENAPIDDESNSDDKLATELGDKYKASTWSTRMTHKLRLLSRSNLGGMSSDLSPDGKYATSFFKQFWYLSKRAVLNITRNVHNSLMQIVLMGIFGLLMGTIYFQMALDKVGYTNRVGAFFFIVMVQAFSNLNAVALFIQERKIFVHENSIGFYRVSAYFFAKLLCDVVPMRIIPNIFFSVIVYFMTGLVEEVQKFFIFFLMTSSTSLAAISIAFCFSASGSSYAVAQGLIGICLMCMMVFGGLIVNVDSILDWLAWMKWLSIFRYGLNGLLINEVKGLEFCEKNTTTGAINPATCIPGEFLLEEMDIPHETAWHLWVNVVALLSMTLGFLILSYIQLRRLNKYS